MNFKLILRPIKKHPDIFLFLACIAAAACISLYHGEDFAWDVANYHVYLPYALVNGRLGVDITPVGVHTFLNPAVDIPYYLVLKYLNSWPRLAASLQSVWLGFCFFFTFKITGLFLDKRDYAAGGVLACIIMLNSVSVSGWATAATGDMITTSFILAALYLTLKSAAGAENKRAVFPLAAAGFFLGCAFAFKYTVGPFVIGFAFVVLFAFGSFKKSVKFWAAFSAGFILAFALIAGPWMYNMYARFKSPLFPFYNNIFHSPYFEPEAMIDRRFLNGRTALDLFLTPFYTLSYRTMLVIEGGVRTAGLLAYLAASITVFILSIKGKLKKILPDASLRRALLLLTGFLIISYICWFKMFSIIRYMEPADAAGAAVIVFVLFALVKRKYKYFVISAVACFVAFYTIWWNNGLDFGGKIVDVKTYDTPYTKDNNAASSKGTPSRVYPRVEDGSTVILAGWRLSFLVPFMNPAAYYVGGLQVDLNDYPSVEDKAAILAAQSFSNVFFKHRFKEAVFERIKSSERVYVLLSTYSPEGFFEKGLLHYGVKLNFRKCQFINTNITEPLWLCRADKLPSAYGQPCARRAPPWLCAAGDL